ncbi:MAG: M20/M25/M40 family metallo-hydrolase [Limnochordales bacterium]|nr:M20/M25/M40 family metallo-hydrolase [Limnochordales bacterium]
MTEVANRFDDVWRVIEKNRNTYIAWLQELCRIPSVAAQSRGMEEAAAAVRRLLEGLALRQPVAGSRVQVMPTGGFPVVYGEFPGTADRTLLFYNHYDVQPEDPLELWQYPPFGAEIHDGVLYARGAADNKGNLVARIAAVHALQEALGALPLRVKFLVEGEEEIGSVHLPEFCRRHPDLLAADGCIWEFGYKDADGRLQVSLGVKGILYVELVCRGAVQDLHSAQAAIVPNPAWRLVQALNTLKDAAGRVLIDGFYDDVESLTDQDEALLRTMDYDEEAVKRRLEIPEFLNGLTGHDLKRQLVFSPTCNICGLTAGYQGEGSKTVLPSVARAKLDFRLVPRQDPHKIAAQLKEHLRKHGYGDIEVAELGLEHAARTGPDAAIVRSVMEMAEKVTGRAPNVLPSSAGTGPMYEVCQRFGTPAVSVGVGHFASNNHAPNENIRIDDFIEGIKLMAAVMLDFARRKSAPAMSPAG